MDVIFNASEDPWKGDPFVPGQIKLSEDTTRELVMIVRRTQKGLRKRGCNDIQEAVGLYMTALIQAAKKDREFRSRAIELLEIMTKREVTGEVLTSANGLLRELRGDDLDPENVPSTEQAPN